MIDSIEKVCPPGKSDHVGLKWNFIVKGMTKNDQTLQDRFQFTKGNYEDIGKELRDTDWDACLGNGNVVYCILCILYLNKIF